MSDEQAFRAEVARAREVMGDAVRALSTEGGDLRIFSAAFLTAAIELHVEVEGIDGLQKAMSGLATRHLVASGQAGRA